jgi:hypothetical protein
MHIKAGYLSGQPITCCVCFEVKTAGKIYDIDRVGIPDPMADRFQAQGPVSICQACRDEFHGADLELDADAMYEDWRKRHPDEDEVQARENDRYEALAPEGGVEWNGPERHKHMAFKVKG